MPPKQKFTRKEIISASLEIARRDGIASITARGLGEELNSSARPIFTVFKNMAEVHDETVKAAKVLYNEYTKRGLNEKPAFKGVGKSYILFARDEPKLFQLLFMTKDKASSELSSILPEIDDNSGMIMKCIQDEYGLSEEKAFALYQYMWLFDHGIATLYATGICHFTEEEIGELLSKVFIGMLKSLIS